MGTLYYGDNLDILRRYVADESVDLVYLDPPFNSAQNYNAFFQERVARKRQTKKRGADFACRRSGKRTAPPPLTIAQRFSAGSPR